MELKTLYVQLKKAVGGTDNPEGQEVAKAMMVLIVAALKAGPDPRCIAVETGFPAGFLTAITARMCEAGLWTDDDIDECARFTTELSKIIPVSLGKIILRAETAAFFALSAIAYELME